MLRILSLYLLSAGLLVAQAPKPNVIFILCDDLGYGDMGTFFQNMRALDNDRSEPWHVTPKLDTMAAEGLRMPHLYCPAPVCAPSRASLLTGVHQGHATVRNNQFDNALEDNHTLATVLKQAGYATAAIGKWGLQGSGSTPTTWPAYPTKRGFDFFHGYVRHGDGHEHYPKEGTYRGSKEVWENNTEISAGLDECYTTDLFTARAKKWIVDQNTTAPTQPFFMYLAFDTPHAVLELPTMAYPAGSGLTGGLQWTGTPGDMINTATGGPASVDSYYHPDYVGATWDDDDNPGTAEVAWPDVYKRYATSVRRIDDCVGDLIDTLDDLGIGDDTLVIFTTDNGPSIESYLPQNYAANFFNSFGPFDGTKRDCLEGGIRVGGIARWPAGITAGQTADVPCQFHDWMPTFADLAGVPVPARSDGTSLVPTLTGTGTQEAPQVYVEYQVGGSTPGYDEFGVNNQGRSRGQMQMIRFGDHVGVRYSISSHADPFEIYDVINDTGQRTDLAASMPDLQQQMKDSVLRMRRPHENGRPYDNELVPSRVVPASNGIEWKSYTGVFPWTPDFEGMTETASGNSARPDLSLRPQDDDFGMFFTGYIQVPASGSYTFYLSTDTGAELRLHEMTLIDADFGYTSGTEKSATVNLQAGRHPFRLSYHRGSVGSPDLQLSWSGPGIAKEPIPDSAYYRYDENASSPPIAGDDSAATLTETPVTIDVLANDIDDGLPSALSIDSFTQGSHGGVVQNGDALDYTPASDFTGTDTFQYTVTDGESSTGATVTVRVIAQATDGRSAHWAVEEGDGATTLDHVSLESSDLFGTGVSWSHDTPGPASYRSLSFPGTAAGNIGTNRTAEQLGIDGTGAKTITGWIKTDQSVYSMFFGWSVDSSNGRNLRFGLNGSGQLRFEVSGGWAEWRTTALNDGQWHMVGVVIEPGDTTATVQLYIDGTLHDPTHTNARAIDTTATGSEVRLGIGDTATALYWNGLADDVRVYPTALSDAQLDVIRAEMAVTQGPVRWGGAGSEAAPEYWNQPGTGSGENGDPAHWNRADPPNLDGSEDAFINGGGIRKNNGFSIDGGSTMTLVNGAYFRLNPTSTGNFDITGGSHLVIEDGTFLAAVSANTIADAGSTLEVAGGSYVFDAQNDWALGLNGGARLIVRTGATVESTTFLNSQNENVAEGGTFEFAGGTVVVSGNDENPIRAGNGLDGGGYDFTEIGGTLQIDDYTGGGTVQSYLEGKRASGFFKIHGTTATGFGSDHAIDGEWLELATDGSSATIVLMQATGFAAWILGFPVGAQDGIDDDADGDGLPNGLEFFSGGNPSVPGDVLPLGAESGGGALTVDFDRHDQSIGHLDVVAEVSADLSSWDLVPPIVIGDDTASSDPGVTISDEGPTDHIEVSVPMNSDVRKFVRIRVTESAP